VSASARRDDDLADDVTEVRERLARLEMGAEAHEKASAERHGLVLGAIGEIRARLDKADERSWRTVLAVAALAAGSGVGGVELVKALLGG
jgi:hypothetical protein